MSSAIPIDLSIWVIGVGERNKGWFVEVVFLCVFNRRIGDCGESVGSWAVCRSARWHNLSRCNHV